MKMPCYWESINSPSDIVKILVQKGFHNFDIEHFTISFINKDKTVNEIIDFAQGIENKCAVPMNELALLILGKECPAIIVSHNHPQGTLEPSTYDNNITAHITFLCESLGVQLLDHVILTKEGYYSYLENNSRLLNSKNFMNVAEV